MGKHRRYFPSDSEGNAEEPIHEDAVNKTAEVDAEEQILEDAVNKTAEVKTEEPRIPSMLKEPPTLGKSKRRVKSNRLRLRKEPSRIADIVSILKQDEIISIDISYKNSDWEKVVDDNGSVLGYVMKIYISPYE